MNYKYFNPEKSLEIYGGFEDLFVEFLQEFKKHHPELLSDIKAHIQSEDFENLVIKAHTMKGLIAQFQTSEVKEMAFLIEQSAIDKKNDGNMELYLKLEEAVQEILKEAEHYLANSGK